MSRSILLLCIVLLFPCFMFGNYVRVTRDITVTAIEEDHVNINFAIAWENSWRDDFNWDAVYLFLKCRKKGEVAWSHVQLRPDYHTVSSGYSCWVANTSNQAYAQGIFVYRNTNGTGPAAVDITLQWAYKANGLIKNDFAYDEVDYTAMCIEMVYVPNGLFYAGDNKSNQGFKSSYQPIHEKWDLVKLNAGITFDSDAIPPKVGHLDYPPENVANHVNMTTVSSLENAWYSSISNGFLKIVFPKPVTVRYFGISGVYGYAAPTAWELQGRKGSEPWSVLYKGVAADWPVGPSDSYPVSKALQIETPKACDQYMIKITSGGRVAINNVSMTDLDLSLMPDFAYVVDNYGTTIPLYNNNVNRGMYADDKETYWTGRTIDADYPSGFWGFYAMKYEISQEQYVKFLNKLSLTQQQARTIGTGIASMAEGQYVFGDSHSDAVARNGIIIATPSTSGSSVIFGCNLSKDDAFSREDDGLTVACNFLSPADMLAYADWTGLRPMSEMEFEKAGRPSFPYLPELGEWAWNSNDLSSFKSGSNILDEGTASEKLENANINGENKVSGPVRCGSFAAGSKTQIEAGSSYWGIMELSGNLAEICYNANYYGRGFKGYTHSHGNGAINANGATDVSTSYWPQNVNGFALRGGSFASGSDELGISDRTKAWTAYTAMDERLKTATFRLAHSYGCLVSQVCTTYLKLNNGKLSTSNGAALDTICSRTSYTIEGSDLLSSTTTSGNTVKDVVKEYQGRCEYVWYMSENSGATWNIIPDARDRNLTYDKFANDASSPRTVWVKRLMVTPEYVSMTNYIRLDIINNTYRIYRSLDTIRSNNAVAGCLIETSTPAKYTWRWKGQGMNTGILQSVAGSKSDFYAAKRQDFNNLSGTSFTVECEMNIQKCVQKVDIDIYVESRPEKTAVPSSEIVLAGADATKRCGVMMMDPRDGEIYGTVEIGGRCWMSENLRHMVKDYSYIQKGDGNPKVTMGLFYRWDVKVRDNACPAGWSLPTNAEYEALKTFLNSDGNTNAGLKMKAGNYWAVNYANQIYQGENSSGFSAMGVGHYENSGMGSYAYYLTYDAYYYRLDLGATNLQGPWAASSNIMSIRCILDVSNK